MANDIGIDLGTRNSRAYSNERGLILVEPTVVVYDRNQDRIRSIGEDARSMTGQLLGDLELIWPIRQGTITDYIVLEKLLRILISRALGRHAFRKPRITICVPAGITDIGRRALEEAAYQSGARKVLFVRAPLAAAIGAGIDIARPNGNLVIDVGAGAAEAAVLSMTGITVSGTARVGGFAFNQEIISYVRSNYSLFISDEIAEMIKIRIGSACTERNPRTMEVKGRNVNTGLTKIITLTSDDVSEAVKGATGQIVELAHQILEKTPPELAADIIERGIILTGGGALLSGLDRLIELKTGVSAMTAPNASSAVAVGTGRYAAFMDSRFV